LLLVEVQTVMLLTFILIVKVLNHLIIKVIVEVIIKRVLLPLEDRLSVSQRLLGALGVPLFCVRNHLRSVVLVNAVSLIVMV
jgi:hypothetical protein